MIGWREEAVSSERLRIVLGSHLLAGVLVLGALFALLTLPGTAWAHPGQITEFQLPFEYAPPITAGPDGNLWFAGGGLGRVTPAGQITEYPLLRAGFGPRRITAGPDGNVWFTGDDKSGALSAGIGRITPAGQITEFPIPSSKGEPIGITTGPEGNIWFTGEKRMRSDGLLRSDRLPNTPS